MTAVVKVDRSRLIWACSGLSGLSRSITTGVGTRAPEPLDGGSGGGKGGGRCHLDEAASLVLEAVELQVTSLRSHCHIGASTIRSLGHCAGSLCVEELG